MGLFGSAILFVGLHFLLSHPLRKPLVRRVGERAFQAIYSLIALLTFGSMIYFYAKIGRENERLWNAGEVGWIGGTVLMWLASILLVGSFVKNPALVGARGPTGGPHGVFRITRHPMMWAFAIWAAVHLMIIAAPRHWCSTARSSFSPCSAPSARTKRKPGSLVRIGTTGLRRPHLSRSRAESAIPARSR